VDHRSGRTVKRHRREIRQHFGFRGCGEEDGAKVAGFLAGGLALRERRNELVKEEFLAECRLRRLKPPSAEPALVSGPAWRSSSISSRRAASSGLR
jgi:hypothetical protein